MARAAFGYRDLALAGTITASHETALNPATLLQDPHVARKWRGTTASESLVLNLGSLQSIDTAALIGCSGLFGDTERNLSTAALTRVRVSTADGTGAAGDAYDSDSGGASAGRIDQNYGKLIYRLPAPVIGRYVRIDLAESGATFVEAGILSVYLSTQVAINFQPGFSALHVDLSRKTKALGGQTHVDLNNRTRSFDVNFEFLSAAERNGFVEDMAIVNGEHENVLLIFNPDSTNLGRDSAFGLIEKHQAIVQPYGLDDIFQAPYRIEERL